MTVSVRLTAPLDRALATRLAAAGLTHLIAEAEAGSQRCLCVGTAAGEVLVQELDALGVGAQGEGDGQWWRGLRPILDLLA